MRESAATKLQEENSSRSTKPWSCIAQKETNRHVPLNGHLANPEGINKRLQISVKCHSNNQKNQTHTKTETTNNLRMQTTNMLIMFYTPGPPKTCSSKPNQTKGCLDFHWLSRLRIGTTFLVGRVLRFLSDLMEVFQATVEVFVFGVFLLLFAASPGWFQQKWYKR